MTNTTFNITELAGDYLLVDDGADREVTLDASGWAKISGNTAMDKAAADYDEAIKEFWAPLTKAAENLENAATVNLDEDLFLVTQEAVEGTESRDLTVVELDMETAVVRLLRSGDTSRLRWVGRGDSAEIVITAKV